MTGTPAMRTRTRAPIVATLRLLIVALVMVGCGRPSPHQDARIWAGANTGQEMIFRYARFTGVEQADVELEAGQTLDLAYGAAVKAGSLDIAVLDPQGDALWGITLTDDATQQQVAVRAAQTGPHTVRVTGHGTRGKFALSWTVR